jgi:hypothetical protein
MQKADEFSSAFLGNIYLKEFYLINETEPLADLRIPSQVT